jgi:hypothetical protein
MPRHFLFFFYTAEKTKASGLRPRLSIVGWRDGTALAAEGRTKPSGNNY